MTAEPADEWPHDPPGGGSGSWEESWYFDFAAADAGLGLFVRLAFHPRDGTAWYWAYLARRSEPLVAVRDHDVALPRGRSLEIRASGLWADAVCETPLDHWTLGLEAFAVCLDEPAEAYGAERGQPTALGLDLEWEATGPAVEAACGGAGRRYEQACEVHGEVLVGSQRLTVSARGHRYHQWGRRDWDTTTARWAAGHLDDATGFAVSGSEVAVRSDAGLIDGVQLSSGGTAIAGAPVAHAPVRIDRFDGGPVVNRLARALCRFEADDGRTGAGWAERAIPGS